MRSSRLLGPVLAAALVLAACNDDSMSGSAGSRFRVLLTDAPGDLAAAHIQIDKVILLGGAGNGRIELTPEVSGFINLINLSNGTTLEIIDTDEVPVGEYREMRVVLGDSYITTDDGRVFATAGADLPDGVTANGTLKCPSCSSSGFKVKVNGSGLQVLEDATFILDFDAGQSFGHEAGRSGQWIMHPVLRVDAQTVRFARVGGTVTLAQNLTLPACGGGATSVEMFRPIVKIGDSEFFGTVNAQGAFTILRLLPGSYTVDYVKEVTFTNGQKLVLTATPSVASVPLAEADDETVNFQITAAVCQ